MQKNTCIIVIAAILFSFVAGEIFGVYTNPLPIHPRRGHNYPPHEKFEHRKKALQLVRPLLECGEDDVFSPRSTDVMQEAITKKVNDILSQKKAQTVSVYVRNLNNGPWFGVDFDATFTAASLFKVPLAMSVMELADDDKKILENKVAYPKPTFTQKFLPPTKKLTPGSRYTISDMTKQMLIYSDNDAAQALFDAVGHENAYETFDELGIERPDTDTYSVSIRTYASFFRILYNGTFINPVLSEQLLEWLSKADFTDGLRAGVPNNIIVAHKFGETSLRSGVKQFHDCGIVYYPEQPYLICVMSKGNSFPQLIDNIKEISKIVYEVYDQEVRGDATDN